MDYRIERDSLGELRVPAGALYGAQTQRALDNFRIGGRPMPGPFLTALALIKEAAAEENGARGALPPAVASALAAAAADVAAGAHREHFPVDIYQTGSGTSSNMNCNEVIARLASARCGATVHPNDHANCAQSSNDVIPSALQLSCCRETTQRLLPAVEHLEAALLARAAEFGDAVKLGRTHLMDAMPLRVAQEFGAWAEQLAQARAGIAWSLQRLQRLPLGGTAVGTGTNAPPDFGAAVLRRLARRTGLALQAQEGFRNLGSQDAAVAFSGQLNVLATALLKLCNDLRWMNSGPLAGLGEITLPALQPGSSIMPGKVNPVIPEAVAMACVQVSALHGAVTSAGQSGNFQLNVMLPLIASNLLDAVALLAGGARDLADRAITGLELNREVLESRLSRHPVLVTALNARLGYERGAAIAGAALAQGRSVLDVAREQTSLSREELETLLDPRRLAAPGVPGES